MTRRKKLPKVFLGSSTESINVAKILLKGLSKISTVRIWDSDVFQLSKTSIEDLINAVNECDFGVFVFSPDDSIKIRGKKYTATRDNVIFELGLFMGKLGRERCIFVVPHNIKNFRIPSDLLGIKYCPYIHKSKSKSELIIKEFLSVKKVIKKLGRVK